MEGGCVWESGTLFVRELVRALRGVWHLRPFALPHFGGSANGCALVSSVRLVHLHRKFSSELSLLLAARTSFV